MAIILAALIVGLDQLTKLLVVNSMNLGASIPLALGFNLTHSRNTGAAFGLLRDVSLPLGSFTIDGTFMLGLLSATVSAGLVLYLLANSRQLGALTRTALGLVLAGAVGNMIDRFRLGYVVDFIHFKVGSFDFPIFNVADSCVVIGAGLLIVASFAADRSAAAEPTGGFKRGPAPRRRHLEELPDVPPLVKPEEGSRE